MTETAGERPGRSGRARAIPVPWKGAPCMLIHGYDAHDQACPCRVCWAPGLFEHRASTLSGSRNTGSVTKECLTRAYRGCPEPLPAVGHDLGQHPTTGARAGGRPGGLPP